MKRKIRRFIAMVAAFCIAFTGMPLMTGSLDSHAASKFTIKTAEAVSPSAVKLTWKKYKKSNAYEVYRDGELVGTLTKTTFTDEGLKGSTEYSYRVKALKKYTQKQKQWFNKKTGEWQKKKPAKKYRGKSKTVKVVKYKNLGTSKAKVVTTKADPRPPFDNTDLDQDAGSAATVKVYVLDHINVKVDYSETENLKDRVTPGYTNRFEYNKNGLLKKSSSTADTNRWGSHTGIEAYSYTGSKVREMYIDNGESLPEKYVYTYENGKLKSSLHTYPGAEDEEPFTEYYKVNSMGRVESNYYSITTLGEVENFEYPYQYNDKGYLSSTGNPSSEGYAETLTYDEHGNVKEYVYHGEESPVYHAIVTRKNTAANSYTDGRLSRTLITDYNNIKTDITLSYKEISIPEEYYKAFTAQQHDVVFRYVYSHIILNYGMMHLPLGLVG